MVAPIQSLLNMETMLYGAPGLNMSVPNYFNNYTGVPYNSYDSLANAYGYLNPDMYYNSAYDYNSAALANAQAEQTSANLQNNKDMQTLANYYAKSLSPSESLGSAIMGMGVMGAVMNNPRYLAHPINSLIGSGDVHKMFKDPNIKALWDKNYQVMQEAYFQMHKASSRKYWKLGLFRKKYSAEEYKQLKEIMERALKSNNIDEIAKASETLKHAYVNNGGWFKFTNGVKNFFTGSKNELPSVASRIADKTTIANNTKELLKTPLNPTFKQALKKGGIGASLLFAGIELFFGMGNIKTAFAKDKEDKAAGKASQNYGMKQLGQTTVKALGNAAGWAAGEAAGIWAAGALGAKIGTFFGPGVGTAIGGVIGMVGGAIGMWLTGKVTKALVGDDIANQINVNNKLKTEQGQQELLFEVGQIIKKDKDVNPQVASAFNTIITQYA